MALFQSSVLKDHLRVQEEQQVEKAYKKFTAFFHNSEIQENIRSSKEEQFQATFLSELFVKVLGYTMNPQPGYELTTEFKNQKNARKADGAILKDGLAIGVIELKGTNTKHLEGIRQQAFDYKANQKGCVYVVTSNFEKLRFYINDATEFIEFDLFELTRKDFSLLYLCLHKDNIFSHRPLKIKEASLVEEEVITKQFYKDYSVFKRELFRDLVLRNVDRIKKEGILDFETSVEKFEAETKKQIRLSLFKKSQKLIDRFLFIFFAEDRGLLPPNSIHRIIADWNKLKDLDAETPLYKRFQLYFSYLDTGRKGTDKKAEIFAYNGGLFKPDPILDMIEIDDDLLYKHTARLATYDFESQVDVNILGHIFENSLNEIESVSAEIEGGEFDKQKSKRKKDGVFYTPKYITKYIVENTVGRLCEEKKSELGFREEEYYRGRKQRQAKTVKDLLKILEDYRDWLLKLTICDPASGSGAFLNQALDFLIKEHQYIDEMKAKLLGGSLLFSDIETTILENNIYGVDINEESVEIAKLSLWLRTAQPRRKLNDLSSNIKCGNSLIDDPKVAGKKAFKWEAEFPEVFANGGFDVVIGNPPYVRAENINKKEREYFIGSTDKYSRTYGRFDLYILFNELGISILKRDGFLSYIFPSSFFNQKYSILQREWMLKELNLIELVDLSNLNVFVSVAVDTAIILVQKSDPTNKISISKPNSLLEFSEIKKSEIEKDVFLSLPNITFRCDLTSTLTDLIDKIQNQARRIDDVCYVVIGAVPHNSKTGASKDRLISKEKTNDNHKKYLEGKNVGRFRIEWPETYLKYIPEEMHRPKFPEIFENPKLFVRNISTTEGLMASFDENYHYCNDTMSVALQWYLLENVNQRGAQGTRDQIDFSKINNPQFILAQINSKLNNFYFKLILSSNLHVYPEAIRNLPFIHADNSIQENIKLKVDFIQDSGILLERHKNKFVHYIISCFALMIVNKKLEKWHELEFGEFIKELNKAIKTSNKERSKEGLSPVPLLTKKDEFEWMELFEENKKKAQELQREIEKTDKEIDRMVYELYRLTEEEIGIVEGNKEN
ncbi:MAG: TaqI-like C-terminal specificity domain-containing protein [Gillisia sp.]